MKPRVFIGSSVEGLSVAYSIQQNLTYDAEATVWDQGVFELSSTTIESLNRVLANVDYGIFVFSPDDETVMRGEKATTVRDNVLFELGLFIGKLGRERVFFIAPNSSSIHIPTDLVGITPAKYDPDREDKSLQAATGPACNQIRIQMKKLGLIKPLIDSEDAGSANDQNEEQTQDWLVDFFDKKYDLAKTKLNKIISEESSDDGHCNNKVWLAYVDLKISKKAGFDALRQLAEEYEDSVETLSLIITIFRWENYNTEAIRIAESALKKYPSDSAIIVALSSCYVTDEVDTAIKLLKESSPESDHQIALSLANIYEDKGLKDEAISLLHSAYINFPNNESVIKKLADLFYEKELSKEALYLYQTLTLNHPKNPDYWGTLSNTCLRLELYNESMIAVKKANELSENKKGWILMNIGNLLNNKGFYSDASEYLTKAIEIESLSEYAHDRLAKSIKNAAEENKKMQTYFKEGRSLLKHFKTSSE